MEILRTISPGVAIRSDKQVDLGAEQAGSGSQRFRGGLDAGPSLRLTIAFGKEHRELRQQRHTVGMGGYRRLRSQERPGRIPLGREHVDANACGRLRRQRPFGGQGRDEVIDDRPIALGLRAPPLLGDAHSQQRAPDLGPGGEGLRRHSRRHPLDDRDRLFLSAGLFEFRRLEKLRQLRFGSRGGQATARLRGFLGVPQRVMAARHGDVGAAVERRITRHDLLEPFPGLERLRPASLGQCHRRLAVDDSRGTLRENLAGLGEEGAEFFDLSGIGEDDDQLGDQGLARGHGLPPRGQAPDHAGGITADTGELCPGHDQRLGEGSVGGDRREHRLGSIGLAHGERHRGVDEDALLVGRGERPSLCNRLRRLLELPVPPAPSRKHLPGPGGIGEGVDHPAEHLLGCLQPPPPLRHDRREEHKRVDAIDWQLRPRDRLRELDEHLLDLGGISRLHSRLGVEHADPPEPLRILLRIGPLAEFRRVVDRRLGLVRLEEEDDEFLTEIILLRIPGDGRPQHLFRQRPSLARGVSGEGTVSEDLCKLEVALVVGRPERQVFEKRIDRLTRVPLRHLLVHRRQEGGGVAPHLELVEDVDPPHRPHEEKDEEKGHAEIDAAGGHEDHQTGGGPRRGARFAAGTARGAEQDISQAEDPGNGGVRPITTTGRGRHRRRPRRKRSKIEIRLDKAEGMGFEPTIHFWTSDFESDRWPIRLPSEPALTM